METPFYPFIISFVTFVSKFTPKVLKVGSKSVKLFNFEFLMFLFSNSEKFNC